MAKKVRLTRVPLNAWTASGLLKDYDTGVKEITEYVHKQLDDPDYGVDTVDPWEDPATGAVGVTATWTYEADGKPVRTTGSVRMLAAPKDPNDPDEMMKELIEKTMGSTLKLSRPGSWWATVVADHDRWMADWVTPAVRLLPPASLPSRMTASLVQPTSAVWAPTRHKDVSAMFDRINLLTLPPSQYSPRGFMRRFVRDCRRLQDTISVLIHEPQHGETSYPSSSASLKLITSGMQSPAKVAFFSVQSDCFDELNIALREHGVQIPYGGAVIVPHDPKVPVGPMVRYEFSMEETMQLSAVVASLSAYMFTPGWLDRETEEALVFTQSVARYGIDKARDEVMDGISLERLEQMSDHAQVEVLKRRAETLQRERDAARADAEAARQQAEQQAKENQTLHETLAEREKALNESVLRRVAVLAVRDRDEARDWAETVEGELDRLASQLEWSRRKLAEAGSPAAHQEPVVEVTEFSSWGELFTMARELLPLVVLGDVESSVEPLRGHVQEKVWMGRTWRGLEMLQGYAEACAAGHDLSLGSYLRWPEASTVIPATQVMLDESLQVKQNFKWYTARVFPVPTSVHPDGKVFMGLHLRIGSGQPPAPRMHCFDATGIDGNIYVGYVGPHLQNTKTN